MHVQGNFEKAQSALRAHEITLAQAAADVEAAQEAIRNLSAEQPGLDETVEQKQALLTAATSVTSSAGTLHETVEAMLPVHLRAFTGDKDDRKALMSFQRERTEAATKLARTVRASAEISLHPNCC